MSWMGFFRVGALLGFFLVGLQVSAQESKQIENQFTFSAEQAVWGSVYVGKYTPGNSLLVVPWKDIEGDLNDSSLNSGDAYIGFDKKAHGNFAHVLGGIDSDLNHFNGTWLANSLTIGSEANSNNQVRIGWLPGESSLYGMNPGGMGKLEVMNDLVINGVSNGNALLVLDNAELKLHQDFDAMMEGFHFVGSNAVLSVGGELSGVQDLDGGYQTIQLFGGNASWAPSNSATLVGATTHSNTLSIIDGASVSLSSLTIGALNTSNNSTVVKSGGSLSIYESLNIIASISNSNRIQIVDGGILNMHADYHHAGTSTNVTAGMTLENGTANFYADVTATEGILMEGGTINLKGATNDITALDGSGIVTLSGEGNVWESSKLIIGGIYEEQLVTNSGVSLDSVTVRVQDGTVLSVDHFELGGNTNLQDNSIIIEDGGKLVLTGTGSRHSLKNPLIMESGSWVTYVQNQDGSDEEDIGSYGVTHEFLSRGFLNAGVDLGPHEEFGRYAMHRQNTSMFNGASALLDYGAYNVHVGDVDGGNTLIFTNGASGLMKSLSMGDFKTEDGVEGGNDNRVLISGDGTTVSSGTYTAIGGTLIGGKWHEGGNNNILRVGDGARFYSRELHNRNSDGTSGLEITSGAVVDVDEYYQGTGALLTMMTDSSGTNMGLLVADTAEFEKGAKVGVDAVAALNTEQEYTNSIVQADQLIIDGVTNGTSSALAVLDATGGSLINYSLDLVGGTNIVATYNRRSVTEGGGIDGDSMLSEIADEIDYLASQGHANASNQVEILNGMSASEVNAQMNQLYSYGVPTFQHNQALFGGLDQARTRGISFHGDSPVGAYGPGPHNPDQGFQPWIDVYGGFGNRDQSGSYDNGYDSSVYGTVLGVDRAFGELLVGLAGGYAGSLITGDNGDESDASTAYGILYGSYGTKQWFADLMLGLGSTSIDNTSGSDSDVASSVDASQAAIYAGVGYEVYNEDSGTIFRPLLAVQSSLFSQGAYEETATTAVQKDVDGYDRWSFQSVLGGEIISPKSGSSVDYETQLRAYWLHEYNNDNEMVDYSLVGSGQKGQFEMRAPESDLALLGLGFVAKLEGGLQLRADVDGQVGKDYYSMLFSGALLYEF